MSKKLCPCGTQIEFKKCCEPFLKEKQIPLTPEQLMRSRFSAFVFYDFKYIQKTMRGQALAGFSLKEFTAQAKKNKWNNLQILNTSINENGHVGFVEFKAQFSHYGKTQMLHEKSEFHSIEGRWYYVDGIIF